MALAERQQLLERALLGYSDREAAEEMWSNDAIKKRWRSIYTRISRVEPALLRTDLNGADQRRDVLRTLRSNLHRDPRDPALLPSKKRKSMILSLSEGAHVQIRHRRALPQDIARGRELLEPERILYSPRTWQLMPELLEDLLARERILLCPLDDVETGRMVGMGASGFLHPDFLEAALASPGGLTDAAFTAESEGRTAFLNRSRSPRRIGRRTFAS